MLPGVTKQINDWIKKARSRHISALFYASSMPVPNTVAERNSFEYTPHMRRLWAEMTEVIEQCCSRHPIRGDVYTLITNVITDDLADVDHMRSGGTPGTPGSGPSPRITPEE